jgi:hypothetical protein
VISHEATCLKLALYVQLTVSESNHVVSYNIDLLHTCNYSSQSTEIK